MLNIKDYAGKGFFVHFPSAVASQHAMSIVLSVL